MFIMNFYLYLPSSHFYELLSDYIKIKYKHVAFRHWPPKLNQYVAFHLHGGYLPTYLPTYFVRWLTLCTMPRITTRKNHPSGLKSGMENFNHAQRHFKQKNLKLPLLPSTWPLWWDSIGICDLTKSWVVCAMWRPPKVKLDGWLWFVHTFFNSDKNKSQKKKIAKEHLHTWNITKFKN
jgi:hypothetical protein